MERWIGKTAIVTGASSGIGYAIAESLATAGIKVVAVARRQEKLHDLKEKCKDKKGKIYAIATDITIEDDILNMFKWTKENVGPVHILINNAGVGRVTSLADGKTKLWKDVLDTNVLGLCIATREAIQDMRANKVDGHIIHINSVAGHRVSNYQFNIYPASKYAVTALTETLRQELNSCGDKIKITSLSPGGVRTEIFQASVAGSGMPIPERQEHLENISLLNPKDIADAVIFVLGTPPHVQIHEMIIKAVGEKF